MTKKQIEEQLRKLLGESGVSIGELRRIFGKVMVEYEQEIGWPESDKGKSWTGAELRVVLSDAPTKENCVKHAKAFARGYGALKHACCGRMNLRLLRSSSILFPNAGSLFRNICHLLRNKGYSLPTKIEMLRNKMVLLRNNLPAQRNKFLL